MDVAFEGAHMIWDGVLRCTADDPEAYYAADARRVLELLVENAGELDLDAWGAREYRAVLPSLLHRARGRGLR